MILDVKIIANYTYFFALNLKVTTWSYVGVVEKISYATSKRA